MSIYIACLLSFIAGLMIATGTFFRLFSKYIRWEDRRRYDFGNIRYEEGVLAGKTLKEER